MRRRKELLQRHQRRMQISRIQIFAVLEKKLIKWKQHEGIIPDNVFLLLKILFITLFLRTVL